MKTRYGIVLGLVGLAASTFAFAADPVAPQSTEDAVVAADRRDVMEEVIVKARHPDAQAKDEAAFQVAIDLSDVEPADFSDMIIFEPEIHLSL